MQNKKKRMLAVIVHNGVLSNKKCRNTEFYDDKIRQLPKLLGNASIF